MSTAHLSPPGDSTYHSSTMSVGDGTWDSSRNDFLLPNLQGLNFATMQYNGMGNRFRGLPQYHTLITGHAVVAAITFAIIVPAAILIARFGFFRTEGRLAFKMHIYLQILTVFLATVVLVLGWFAVGPERSLTNPHHGIGVAIYTCVLLQFLYGWWFAKRERKRKIPHPTIPLKVHIHRLFGRSIALLAFIQIALGLTLYGSPKALFIVYALWGAFLIFLYLTLEYRNKPVLGTGGPRAPSEYYSEYSESYVTGDPSRVTDNRRRRDSRDSRGESHWGRRILAGAGALGAYEWWKGRRDKRRDGRDDRYEESEISHYPPDTPGRQGRPPSSMGRPLPGPSGAGHRPPGPPGTGYGPPGSGFGPPGSSGPQHRPPGPPGAGYGPPVPGHGPPIHRLGPPGPPSGVPPPASYANARPPSRGSHRSQRHDETVMSPQTWENDEHVDEKYGSPPPKRSNTWRDRILGAGAGIAAVQGVKSMFGSRKRRNDGYMDSELSYRPGDQSMVSQTDVSRVQAGQAPFSPDDSRNNRPGNAPPMTPTRPAMGRRQTGRPPVGRTSVDSMSYDDDESYAPPRRDDAGDAHTLRNSIATLGVAAGFREWNNRRKERNEQQRADRIRQQELDEEEKFNRRNSDRYPRPQDASGRRPSMSGTLMTGPEGQETGQGSNPQLSRNTFRPDTSHPPLPAAAGTVPAADSAPPSTAGQGINQTIVQNQQQQQRVPYHLPPPPPGPPPHASTHPQPGSLQMPQGAVNPDPSRLTSEQDQSSNYLYQDGTSAAATEAAAIAAANAAAVGAPPSHRTQSQSPSRRRDSRSRMHSGARRNSSAAASGSRLDSGGLGSAGSPPVSVKVNMHPDGRHVTLRRLGEEEAAAERAARRKERRSRRASSLSSGGEEPSRYRRNGGMRPSNQQPIANVPPPPAMSSSLGGNHRPPSELNLPSLSPVGRVPQASESPQDLPSGLLPAVGAASSGAVGSPGNAGQSDMGTGTDVSAFDNNRRRRRAERARRAEAAKANNRVEFE